MADTRDTETTALAIDAGAVVSGAAQVEQAAKRLEAANSNIERSSQRVADSTRAQERYLDSLTRRYDPAAAAAAKYAQAEARLQGIIAGGGANSQRAAQLLEVVRQKQDEVSKSIVGTGDAMALSAGQMAMGRMTFMRNLQDIGNVAIATRGNITSMMSPLPDLFYGLSLMGGRFAGVFSVLAGPLGTVLAATAALGGAFLTAGSGAADADAAAEKYADSLRELTDLERDYTSAVRERQGLSPLDTSTDAIEKLVRDAEGALRGIDVRSESSNYAATRNVSAIASYLIDPSSAFNGLDKTRRDYDADLLERRRKAQAELEDARRNLSIANDLAEARDKEKLTKTLDDLHKARIEDLAVVRMSADASKEASAALAAERAIREKLKGTDASKEQIEVEVAAAKAVAVEKVQTEAANQAAAAAKSRAEQAAKDAVRKAEQAEKDIAGLEKQAQAEQRLAAASGQRWAVQRQAQLDNVRAEAEAKYGAGPLADRAITSAAVKIDASQSRVQADYLAGLDRQLADIQSKGIARSFGDTMADSLTRAQIEADRLGLSVDQIVPKLEALARAQQTEKLRTFASSLDPSAAYDEQIAKLDALRARMEEFGVSNENWTRAYEEAETRKLEASRKWADGAKGALRRYAANAENYGQRVGSVITSGLRRAEDALNMFANTNQSVWDRVRSFTLGVLADIQAQLVRSQITGPIAKAMSSMSWGDLFSSSGGSDLGNGWSTDATIGYVPNAQGGIYDSPGLSAYSGTVVSHPTIFPFAHGIGLMGEEGAEGIFPLKRTSSGDLGVQAVIPDSAGSDPAATSITNHFVIDARGADREGLARLERQIAALNGSIERRAVSAVSSAASRGGQVSRAIRGR